MKTQDAYIFTHATEIAERRNRHGRTLQAKQAKRLVLAIMAGLGRGLDPIRAAFLRTERPRSK
ncbi:hypothetical protein [Ostreiculturibacter nitratireducens]|uniref:hypothetical protein n=1 Tax=Ostreiculturibacter nitratireducens TaxID=3075226 RepID=UPI0031B5EE6E